MSPYRVSIPIYYYKTYTISTSTSTAVHVEKYRSQKARGFMENERGISYYYIHMQQRLIWCWRPLGGI